jgi:hypothetical protein
MESTYGAFLYVCVRTFSLLMRVAELLLLLLCR